MMSWIGHVLGLDNLSGPWYGFWSGIGGDVALFAWLPLVWHTVKKANCHQPKCWRVGKFPHGQYHYCRVHHPDDDPGRIESGGEFE